MKAEKNMLLINSSYQNVKSFTMIPATDNCPYTEAIFDPTTATLAVIGKVEKNLYRMIAKLDGDGNPIYLDKPNPETKEIYKKERVAIKTLAEYYITSKEDIVNFINIFGINALEFDYDKFFVDISKTEIPKIIIP